MIYSKAVSRAVGQSTEGEYLMYGSWRTLEDGQSTRERRAKRENERRGFPTIRGSRREGVPRVVTKRPKKGEQQEVMQVASFRWFID
jgi:hypothetical protein